MAGEIIDEPGGEIAATSSSGDGHGLFARLALFIRQVIAELKKVITPTRSELFNYTVVVLVFVLIMMGIVFGLDQLFGWVVILIFG